MAYQLPISIAGHQLPRYCGFLGYWFGVLLLVKIVSLPSSAYDQGATKL
jgi:hypothetical protein